MFQPTNDQIKSSVRWAIGLAAGGGLGAGLANAQVITWAAGNTSTIVAVATALAPLIWGLIAHSTTGTISAAKALPDVQNIVIRTDAAPAAQAMAADTTEPKVVRADPVIVQ